jgi:ubiquinone/menaquinone biosynthesis C-methylase UbiE
LRGLRRQRSLPGIACLSFSTQTRAASKRSQGFYERARPEYPHDAVAWLSEKLRIDEHSTVLDLGAGTGKLTRALVPLAQRVVAVEPGREMLAQLERAVPQAGAKLGAAEAIPLPDASVDAVVCGQSFHWFRSDEALSEIHRVLRGRRGLGIVWNLRDPEDELQQEVTCLLDPFVPAGRAPVRDAIAAINADTRFTNVEQFVTGFGQVLDTEEVVRRIASISFVAAAPEPRRRELEQRLRDRLSARGGRVFFRYRTEAYVTFAV